MSSQTIQYAEQMNLTDNGGGFALQAVRELIRLQNKIGTDYFGLLEQVVKRPESPAAQHRRDFKITSPDYLPPTHFLNDNYDGVIFGIPQGEVRHFPFEDYLFGKEETESKVTIWTPFLKDQPLEVHTAIRQEDLDNAVFAAHGFYRIPNIEDTTVLTLITKDHEIMQFAGTQRHYRK